MSDNKLQLIINDSGLETTKARVLLENFKDYFDIADEWETRAKSIVVTDENQKVDMAMARVGRKFLQEKRLDVEKTRKELKEQSLREGKTIDGIANILKGLIVPIEQYLGKQEHFIEIRDAEIAEQKRIEGERLLQAKEEAERIAMEKAVIEERERIRKENEALKAEAIERERINQIERKKNAEILARQQAEADAQRKEIEEQNRKERERLAKIAEAERKNAESEQVALRKKIDEQREASEKLEKMLNEVECPFCHKRFNLKK